MLALGRLAPRTPARRSSRGTACGPRTRPRRCRPACRPGGPPAAVAHGRGPRPRSLPKSAPGAGRRSPSAWPASQRSRARRAPPPAPAPSPRSPAGCAGTRGRSSSGRSTPRRRWRRGAGRPPRAPRGAPGRGVSISAQERARGPPSPSGSAGGSKPGVADLQRAHRLLEALLEGAADRHRLAHRLHLGRELVVDARELLEGEARDLGHHVVDRGLEARRRLARDVVADLVERVADGQLGRDLRDREARGLRGERRRARDPRVHLDHDQGAVLGVRRRTGCSSRRCRRRSRG